MGFKGFMITGVQLLHDPLYLLLLTGPAMIAQNSLGHPERCYNSACLLRDLHLGASTACVGVTLSVFAHGLLVTLDVVVFRWQPLWRGRQWTWKPPPTRRLTS